ncbi:outer membrane lipoprotein SmpA [Brachyspira hyodysenteriae]|uniref:outer membrane lipoprotein SmpA n=1 Tax=Brachyspira hyodysenteriae TaxID=159 RepID=UPI0022CD7AAD|nr:outer membrane lipoprotein SmpA [Brachyspira hyodysenteriae]MCZ9963678.1 outer membrane lipoprotein SmpA [Brachyspira hyodysenteriae]
MNKKIFTLFLVVAASAIFAVSCNNKTTNPTSNSSEKKIVTEEDFKNAIEGLTYKTWAFTGKGKSFNFGSPITVEATSGSDSLAGVEKGFGNALKSALAAKGIDTGNITFDKGGASSLYKTSVSFKFTPKALGTSNFEEKLKSSVKEVEIKLTPKENWGA